MVRILAALTFKLRYAATGHQGPMDQVIELSVVV